MGYIDFDGVRYLDFRDNVNFYPRKQQVTLNSDCSKRSDTVSLLKGDIE